MIKPLIKVLHAGGSQRCIDVFGFTDPPIKMLMAAVQSDPVTILSQNISKETYVPARRLSKPSHTQSNRRSAGEDGDPRRRALRGRRVGPIKPHPLLRKLLQVGSNIESPTILTAVATHMRNTVIIRQNQEHIRARLFSDKPD